MKITRKWKKILSTALACLLLVGAVGAVAAFATNDSKPAGAVFKVGGLDPETGKYVKTDKTIYMEKGVAAYGLRIEPDFESTVTYDVYLYDGADDFLEAELGNTEVYECENVLACEARIVIHPEIPEDVKEKDFKVRFYEVAKYSSMLNITNSKKDAKYDFNNLFVEKNINKGSALVQGGVGGNINNLQTSSILSTTDLIEIDGKYDYYDIYVYVLIPPKGSIFANVADINGNIILQNEINLADETVEGYYKLTINLDDYEEAASMRVSIPIDCTNCYIYGYND